MKIWEDLLQDIEKNIPSGTEKIQRILFLEQWIH